MAKLTVNIGTSANDRTGDNLRTAFNKINTNFTEVYDDVSDLTTRLGVVETGGTVSLTTDTKGSVFADDSTLLVDAVGGKIVGVVETSSTTTTNLTSNGVIDFTNSRIDFADSQWSNIPSRLVTDISGSIFADDSTLIVDGVTGEIPGYVSLAALKAQVAASTDFTDFQSRIAAL